MTTIHVSVGAIERNAKREPGAPLEPVLDVRQDGTRVGEPGVRDTNQPNGQNQLDSHCGTSRMMHSVVITGPCRVVYDPSRVGARVWIETESEMVEMPAPT